MRTALPTAVIIGRALLASAIVICLLVVIAQGAEGEIRWRILEGDNRVMLAATEEDPVQLFGSHFWCAPNGGPVQLVFSPNDETRAAVSEIIRSGNYPSVSFANDKDKGGDLGR